MNEKNEVIKKNFVSGLKVGKVGLEQSLEKKLINYIISRIDRSYGKIFDFIYKIDEISLKKKKSIDFKIIKNVLGD